MKNFKIFLILAVCVVIVGLFNFTIKQNNDLSHTELFSLKSDCADKAIEFAETRSKSELSFVTQWTVLRSDYNQEKQSCFGEFMERVNRDDGSSFGEYWIFDLLVGGHIDGYTFEERDSTGRVVHSEWTVEYLETAKARYENTVEDIFGPVR